MDDIKIDLKQIGQRIRAARIAKKMSQEELAFRANTGMSNISDIELGKSNFQIKTFVGIIEALQVSADSILRADVPVVNNMGKSEFSDILSTCSPDEIETILQLVKNVIATFHK